MFTTKYVISKGFRETRVFLQLESDGKVQWTREVNKMKMMPTAEHAIQLGNAVLTGNFDVYLLVPSIDYITSYSTGKPE